MNTVFSLPIAGAAPVAPPTMPDSAHDHADAKLLELASRLDMAVVEENNADAEAQRVEAELKTERLDRELQRWEEAQERSSAIIRLIETTQAKTIDGLLVKVKAVQWCRSGNLFSEGDKENTSTDVRLCQSMFNDLVAMGKDAASNIRAVDDSPLVPARAKQDRAFASAYFDLESDVRDLTRAARLAQVQLHSAVGQLSPDGHGSYIEAPDQEPTELATFAVDHVAAMAKRFEELYDRLWPAAS